MSYNRTTWKDHVTDPPNRFAQVNNGDGTVTQTRAGTVIQQGTNQSATNFNNQEEGIAAANAMAAVMGQEARQLRRNVADLESTIITDTLTNSLSYPFNNSVKTIALAKYRDTLNYKVSAEATAVAGGLVGNINVTEKTLNGFKIAYDGSATSVTLKIYVSGGMYQ